MAAIDCSMIEDSKRRNYPMKTPELIAKIPSCNELSEARNVR